MMRDAIASISAPPKFRAQGRPRRAIGTTEQANQRLAHCVT
jgi:hypothetical protein